MGRLKRGLALAGLALACAVSAAAAARADDSTEIDLRLFGKDRLDGFDGCRLALWQHNRDPETDRFAFVLFQPFGGDGAPLPAWMKIGDDVIELEPVASGGDAGGGLAEYQVFKDTTSGAFALVDIATAQDAGGGMEIADGRLTLVMNGKLPFRIKVRGFSGCPAGVSAGASADGPQGDGISLGAAQEFSGLRFVPQAILANLKAQLVDLCDFDNTPGAGAVYAISDAMSLWQIPCLLGAYQGSSVFVAAFNDNPEQHVLLSFAGPPGEGTDRFDIISPTIDPATGILSSHALARGAGDCGVFERHRLVAVEGEAVEFQLIEYREKTECDGVATAPEAYPEVFRAR